MGKGLWPWSGGRFELEVILLTTKVVYVQYKDKELPVQISRQTYATNSFLSKIGISETALCYLCKRDKERLIHLFWECSVRKPFPLKGSLFFFRFYPFDTSLTRFGYLWMFRLWRRERWCFSEPMFAPRKVLYLLHLSVYQRICATAEIQLRNWKTNICHDRYSQNIFQQKWHKILHAL